MNYIKDSIGEFRKVTWPTRNQAVKLTIITVIFTAFSTFILVFSDTTFKSAYDYLLEISPAISEEVPIAPSQEGDAVIPDIDLGGLEIEGGAIEVTPVE